MRTGSSYRSEKIERRISAGVSITLCVLTVLLQIGTTLLLTLLLRENAGYVYMLLELAGAIVAIGVYQRGGSPSYILSARCFPQEVQGCRSLRGGFL